MKLATVFSGIGAIEQALHRMGIDYEIVFACDNGDVDLNLLEGEELEDYIKLKKLRSKKQLKKECDIKRLDELGKKKTKLQKILGPRFNQCNIR